MNDDTLVERIRAGDEEAARILIERYYVPILRYCGRQTGAAEAAEDLAQETFFKAFRSLARYREEGFFRAWLYSVAKSVCIDACRRRGSAYVPIDLAPAAGEEDPAIARVEDREEIHGLLAGLSKEQREAILLHYEEELSFREIGQMLGVSARTAQSRVNSGIKKIRRKWQNER